MLSGFACYLEAEWAHSGIRLNTLYQLCVQTLFSLPSLARVFQGWR